MAKKIKEEKPKLVTRVSLIDTFRSLKPGTCVTFDCRRAGPLSTAQSCATRLNQAAGYKEYRVETSDNGSTYTVTRDFQPQ